MRRTILGFLAALVSALGGCAIPGERADELRIVQDAGPNPWSHLDFQRDPDDFRFAIVTDLTGGYREGIFPESVLDGQPRQLVHRHVRHQPDVEGAQ